MHLLLICILFFISVQLYTFYTCLTLVVFITFFPPWNLEVRVPLQFYVSFGIKNILLLCVIFFKVRLDALHSFLQICKSTITIDPNFSFLCKSMQLSSKFIFWHCGPHAMHSYHRICKCHCCPR